LDRGHRWRDCSGIEDKHPTDQKLELAVMPRSEVCADYRSRTSCSSSNGKRMSTLLRQHYLEIHKMRLENNTCTAMVRTLSKPGLERVT
ncbi:unnamed protein product, partial [Ascophyllum nodosum]